MTRIVRILLLTVATGAAAFLPLAANATAFSSMFVFGDSLSDTGNNAAVIDSGMTPYPPGTRTPTPISSPAFIPDFPYASNRYSNGPVWVEGLAAGLGLSAQPSLLGGTNFAFGGARTGPLGSSFPYSLLDQTQAFLGATTAGVAPSSALYVIFGGGNDAFDALSASDLDSAVSTYAANIHSIITTLETAGAYHILLLNVPDIGVTPAAQAMGSAIAGYASFVASQMNDALNTMLGGLSPAMTDGIRLLDTYTLLDQIYTDPAAFGLTDATSACAFNCIDGPDATFFWDGIHPTTAGHAILAQAALRTVPEPGTVLLIAIAALALLAFRPRRAPSRSAVPA